MSQPQVSILVTAYNEAEYIEECLQSILRQSYPSWTAVVVNNCSGDATGELADKYARLDGRMRVVHCDEFVSQADNYNRALSMAANDAEFIKLVEADNWIDRDCLSRLVERGLADPQVGVVGSYHLKGTVMCCTGIDYRDQVLSGVEVVRKWFLENRYLLGIPTSILFRAEAIRAIRPWFRSGLTYGDADLITRILSKWKFGFVHQVLSYQRIDNNGVSHTITDCDFVAAYKHFLLADYGSSFFGEDELKEVVTAHRDAYFNVLAKALFRRRSSHYWDFHRSLWRLHGHDLTRQELAWHAIRMIINLCGNPKSTVQRIRNVTEALTSKTTNILPVEQEHRKKQKRSTSIGET